MAVLGRFTRRTGGLAASARHTPSQSISIPSAVISVSKLCLRQSSKIFAQSRCRSVMRSEPSSASHCARTPGLTLAASHLARGAPSFAAKAEASGRSSSDASISITAFRVRATKEVAALTRLSASCSSSSQGRETAMETPTNPDQSIARSQISPNICRCFSIGIPAKESRSMLRITGVGSGCHVAKAVMSRVVQRLPNDPADRGSTSRRPSIKTRGCISSSAASPSARANQTTWSIGLGSKGSIQLNAWIRPVRRHRSIRSARAAGSGTRRSSSRISSERSAIDASE